MLDSVKNTIQHHVQHHLMNYHIDSLLSNWVALLSLIAGMLVISVIGYCLAKLILIKLADKTSEKQHYLWVKSTHQHRLFHRLSLMVPGFLIYLFVPLVEMFNLPFMGVLSKVMQLLATIYIILVAASVLAAFLNSIETRYRYLQISQHYSIKSYIQVGKIFLYLLTAILLVSCVLNKSPMYFLTGLGAMTAVLMLVFKDSILGFVASVQLTANDMVRMGDWIEIPSFGVNGTVIDISLNTIKVKNFDNTIVTIPSHSILTNGVKNWRGMSESGGRRIKRSLLIDVNSVKFCDDELLKQLADIPLLESPIKKLLSAETNLVDTEIANLSSANKHCVTNLTLFRLFVEEYLRVYPGIHREMTTMVRELQPEGKGIPVELYLFSADTNWVNFEKFQANLFDYIYAILPLFKLTPFQYLSKSGMTTLMGGDHGKAI